MKIGVTKSPVLLSRIAKKKRINVDYIEVNGEDGQPGLSEALLPILDPSERSYEVLLHDISGQFWLNYADPFDAQVMANARRMIDLARPPWFSTGIGASAEPQGHTTDYWRGAPSSALQPREVCLGHIVRNGRRLTDWLGLPLLLENYNYHPTNAYEYVCEPGTFSRLIDAIGCQVLLDLAHAQISAYNLSRVDPREYLSALPLAKVREIHINHPFLDQSDLAHPQMLDRHLPLQAGDLDLLRWTLDHAPNVEAITLESEPDSEDGLLQEIDLLHAIAG